MQALSASNMISDPYRAGVALGEALSPITPEVVFLFGSVHYFETSELLEGLYDALGREDLVLIGSSGDGFYETQRVSELGVSALALNSSGAVRWQVVTAAGATAEPAQTTRASLQALDEALGGEKPAFIFLVSDFHADGSRIQEVIRYETDVPVVGGYSADDNRLATCFLCANREIVRDSIVLLGAVGPLSFDISIGNALTPVGHPGRIDEVDGTNIRSIDGISAMAFIERETGKPILPTDRGFVTLTIIEPDHPELKQLRSIIPDFSTNQGTLGLYGGIERGNTVQVCLGNSDDLVREVYAIADRSRRLAFEPSAALIVSCGWRKQILGAKLDHEIRAVSQAFPGLPIAGFSSFGEIGPLKQDDHYTRNLYHNMTYVLLLIGTTI